MRGLFESNENAPVHTQKTKRRPYTRRVAPTHSLHTHTHDTLCSLIRAQPQLRAKADTPDTRYYYFPIAAQTPQ